MNRWVDVGKEQDSFLDDRTVYGSQEVDHISVGPRGVATDIDIGILKIFDTPINRNSFLGHEGDFTVISDDPLDLRMKRS
jgi:hypothetical protein